MASYLKRMLGIVHVEQHGDTIELGGVATQALTRDIREVWGTSKVVSNMFTDLSGRHIAFKEFFALEVHYMLQQLLTARSKWSRTSTIKSALVELQENTWLSMLQKDVDSSLDQSKLSVFKKTPLPHQTKFFDVYDNAKTKLGLNGYLLSAAAGSGKTLTGLMLAEMRHSDHVIIVAPNNSIYRVWNETLQKEYKKPQPVWIAGENKPYKGERFLVTHYEGLDKLVSVLGRVSGQVTVIVDESHNFNEITSARTQTFIRLCQRVKSEDVIWSSGTPIKALGGECIPLLKTIDPKFDSDVEAAFKGIFGINARRALDILRNRMGMISYRVEKEDVIKNENGGDRKINVKIPNGEEYTLDAMRKKMAAYITERLAYYEENLEEYETTYENCLRTYEPLIKTTEERSEYKRYQSSIKQIRKGYDPRDQESRELGQFCNYFEKKYIMPKLSNGDRKLFHSARSVIKYVQLKVMGEALGTVLGRARAQVHVEMLPHIDFDAIMSEAEKKTVIFTSYVAVVKELDKVLRTNGHKPMLVYGETNKDLTSNVGAFETDPKVNPLVATYMSLSTAVPLIMADQEIFINQPFRDHEMVQARARIDRLGQDTSVKFVSTLLDTGEEPNISTRSKDILEWSREQVSMIMGTESTDGLDGYIASLESLNAVPTVIALESALVDCWNEVTDPELVESLEGYREGGTSTFTSQGKTYQLDTIFDLVESKSATTLPISDLDWILAFDKPRPERVEKADPKIPIVVLHEPGQGAESWIVVDGLHRLQSAKNRSMARIAAKVITPEELKKALINNN